MDVAGQYFLNKYLGRNFPYRKFTCSIFHTWIFILNWKRFTGEDGHFTCETCIEFWKIEIWVSIFCHTENKTHIKSISHVKFYYFLNSNWHTSHFTCEHEIVLWNFPRVLIVQSKQWDRLVSLPRNKIFVILLYSWFALDVMAAMFEELINKRMSLTTIVTEVMHYWLGWMCILVMLFECIYTGQAKIFVWFFCG